MNCACMDIPIKLARKRGPKPSAVKKVVYYRRVTPEWIERLDEYLASLGGPRTQPGVIVEVCKAAETGMREGVKEVMKADLGMAMELAAIKKQLEAMTTSYVDECEKVAALSLRLDHLNREMDDCLGMTEEDKTRYWRDRAFRAESTIKAKSGEYDQTQS